MKNYLKKLSGFSKVIAMGLAFSLCFVVQVQAGDYGSSGQPYFSLSTQMVSADAPDARTKVSFPRAATVLTFPNASLDSEVGWGVTGAVGWLYDSNWHYEVELAHKAFDLADAAVTGNPQPVVGEWNIETFFINGGYDFRSDSFITPYLELGVGASLHELTINSVNSIAIALQEQFTVTAALQARVGVNLEVADDMDIVVGYRFVTLIDPDFNAITFSPVDIHNFELGLKFYIEDWIN